MAAAFPADEDLFDVGGRLAAVAADSGSDMGIHMPKTSVIAVTVEIVVTGFTAAMSHDGFLLVAVAADTHAEGLAVW